MQFQLFEQTTSVSTSSTVIFDSEAYGLSVDLAVFMGMTIANLSSGSINFQVDIKAHPNGSWFTHTAMGGGISRDYSNVSNSFYRLINILTAQVAANGTGAISANLKFVYAFRILAIATSGTNLNIRVRGNIKIPKDFNYEEQSVQQVIAGAVTTSSPFTVIDTSQHAYLSLYMTASGTNTVQTMAANSYPGGGGPSTYGELLSFAFYPGDFYIRFGNPNSDTAIGGSKNSQILEASLITAGQRRSMHRFNVEAAYEIGFLFNIPGESTIDYYVSLNG